jgi:hypothetical protein
MVGKFRFLALLWIASGAQANPETGNFTIEPSTRVGAQAGYYRHYVPSEGFAATMGWTGNVASNSPGTVSATFLDNTLRRINYFRAQSGLPADIVLTNTKNEKSQWAALIMARQNALSHYPADDWPTNPSVQADIAAHGSKGWGHEAAGVGNLSLGSYGPQSVTDLIVDSGSNNSVAGHRRWLLYPRAAQMGVGAIPTHSSPYNSSTNIWVIGDFKSSSAATNKLVPWPNAGYIPYSLVPNSTNTASFGGQIRWTCGYTLGNFSAATISMTRTSGAGSPAAVAVTKETYATGYGDNTVSWLINSGASLVVPTAGQDIAYSITISGITLSSGSPPAEFTATGGGNYSYTYTVTTFDHTHLPHTMTMTGPSNPPVGLSSSYTLNPLPESSGNRVQTGSLSAAAWNEGAEDSPTPKIVDGTSTIAPYTLRDAGFKSAGSKAFHLAFPTGDSGLQSFTVDRTLVPSATSQLQFKNRLRLFSTTSTLRAQASLNGGLTWDTIWSRPGDANSNSGSSATLETTFQTVNLAIPATYHGKIIKLRFTISKTGSFFSGSTSLFGAYVDEVTVTNAQEFISSAITELAGNVSTYNFTPATAGSYALFAQMELGDTQYFDFGPLTTVTAAAPTALQSWRSTHFGNSANAGNGADVNDADGDGLDNLVEYAFATNPNTPSTNAPGLPTAVKSGNNMIFTFTPSAGASGVTYAVEQSSSLAPDSWSPVAHSVVGGVYTASVPMSSTKVFLRLRVTNLSAN